MKLAVVGDSLLDIDIEGTADRLCPDAPAPVLDVRAEHVRPGGAGLAAALAQRDGVDVTLVTAVADDADGVRLRDALAGVPAVFGPSPAATSVKARLRSGGHSIARMDRGGGRGKPRATDEMLDAVRDADLVLVSDYGRGLADDDRLRAVLARRPVVWDPHPRGPAPTPDARLVTPNRSEADRFSGEHDAADAARSLRDRWSARAVVVTLGAEGALLDTGGTPVAVPARQVAVVDPCGAGDRFAVTAAARLMAGSPVDEAVAAAVASAAEFLAKGGASGFRPDPVSTVDSTRARGGVVVATGGCFDLLHAGHVRTLEAARALGDCLVVCLNSDESVRRLKGPDRPVTRQHDRAEVLRALGCVDEVVVFGEDTPERVLAELRPDIWVKGGDYRAESLPEAGLVRSWGGRTVVVPYHRGRSTTQLLARRS
ncbi:rfaE bifunctional protein nucleotidyltransferase chain/domain/rfaE bifunctional protein kinase chain/domain [Saccharothrix tamanrassetensis]|uniref:D-glycero-beta-D-manno-heptose 1-phosphate adenylyltransferase n=1 Tax=Saccharothrix tamanrassetensis TaxID=1051531 RepID=A0A841CSK9_9PSEU|nr:D-glycero-beta-D-manno-heptose 1-phosphate adenylyltransferase [Saccharothrix tamanrassetensis]MBB5960250.1 rfaE bifunctional protein nucleotidyltransferase chain/domain/rfaE bifunctional protein kinase chain/domain [Saccharothrix tamanrassetensis]